MTKEGTTILYLDEDGIHDLELVLDSADMVAEEQRKMHHPDEELETAVHNISVLADIDMEEVRAARKRLES